MQEVSPLREVNDNYESVEMDIDSNPGSPSKIFLTHLVYQPKSPYNRALYVMRRCLHTALQAT